MRLPFLRSKTDAEPPRERERKRPAAKAEALRASGDDAVAEARTRARRRLVGAVVLLALGVIGFPILFETQPRPLPLDTPIEVPRRDPAAPAAPVARVKPVPLPALPVDAGNEVSAPPAEAAVATSKPDPAPVAASAPAPAPAPLAARPPATAPAAERVAAVQPPVVASAAAGRFVVQVGAYTDATMLRDARAKVEKLGLKTYTQVIENDAGKRTRVRLGPFATRDEADAAAAKLKRAGLPANILTL